MEEAVTLWEWIIIFILFLIPLANLIVLMALAAGNGRPSLVTFSRASLILFGVFFALGVLTAIIAPGLLGS